MLAMKRILAVTAAAVLAVSCATDAPNRRTAEYLDEATGATITRVSEPFLLASDDPARAANARDYIHAAPLAVNQGGRRSYWLWLGVWSTIDRGASAGEAQPADITAIQLIVDGEPMDLDMGARVERIPGVTRLPYAAPVDTARAVVLPLTASQVSRLGRGSRILIHTAMSSDPSLLWQPWVRNDRWTGFAELAASVPATAVAP